MKKLVLLTMVVSALGVSTAAVSATHTVSLGYEQSKIKEVYLGDNLKTKGFNVKYRFEWESPISVITSFSYKEGDDSDQYSPTERDEIDVKTYSLAAGPAYRFNDYISAYGLLGVDISKTKYEDRWSTGYYKESKSASNFLFGAGVQVNPVNNWALDISYQQSKVSFDDDDYTNRGFSIGAGYRF